MNYEGLLGLVFIPLLMMGILIALFIIVSFFGLIITVCDWADEIISNLCQK